MGYCKADDATTCERCGALVEQVWMPEHNTFHERIEMLLTRASETPDSPRNSGLDQVE